MMDVLGGLHNDSEGTDHSDRLSRFAIYKDLFNAPVVDKRLCRQLSFDPPDSYTRGAIQAVKRINSIVEKPSLYVRDVLNHVEEVKKWNQEDPRDGDLKTLLFTPDTSSVFEHENAYLVKGYTDLRRRFLLGDRDVFVLAPFKIGLPEPSCPVFENLSSERKHELQAHVHFRKCNQRFSLMKSTIDGIKYELRSRNREIDEFFFSPAAKVKRASHNTANFRFFDLPPEIQDMILKFSVFGTDFNRDNRDKGYIFDSLKPLGLKKWWDTKHWRVDTYYEGGWFDHYNQVVTKPLLQVNQHFRTKGMQLLFEFPLHFFSLMDLCWFLSSIGPRRRSQIRHIELFDSGLFEYYTYENFCHTFELLVDCERLEYFRLEPPPPQGDVNSRETRTNRTMSCRNRPKQRIDILEIESLKKIRGLKDAYIDTGFFGRGSPHIAACEELVKLWKSPREEHQDTSWKLLKTDEDTTWARLGAEFEGTRFIYEHRQLVKWGKVRYDFEDDDHPDLSEDDHPDLSEDDY